MGASRLYVIYAMMYLTATASWIRTVRLQSTCPNVSAEMHSSYILFRPQHSENELLRPPPQKRIALALSCSVVVVQHFFRARYRTVLFSHGVRLHRSTGQTFHIFRAGSLVLFCKADVPWHAPRTTTRFVSPNGFFAVRVFFFQHSLSFWR